MCEFHESTCNGLGDIWWTDNPIYFSSIDGRHTRIVSPFQSLVVKCPRALSAKLRILLCGVVRSNLSLKRRKVDQSGYITDWALAVNHFQVSSTGRLLPSVYPTMRLQSSHLLVRNYVHRNQHLRNEEILEEAKMEAISTVMRRRRLEWFGHVKRRGETEHIRAVAEMKMKGKRHRGQPKLRWNDTVRRDLKDWNIKEEWATDRERWKGLCKTRYPEHGDGGERWER